MQMPSYPVQPASAVQRPGRRTGHRVHAGELRSGRGPSRPRPATPRFAT